MNKSERLNQEMIFLSGKTTFQVKDLMAEFHVSKRTALRDIAELELLGLPFYVENGRYGGYRLINQKLLVPVYFSNEEIQAIFFALKALSLLSSTPFEKSYEHIRQKLLATIPETQQQQVSQLLEVIDYLSVPPVKELKHLPLILQAILDEKVITATNQQQDDQVVQLQILELFYRRGIWFCSGYDMERKKWGTYRCDYLSEVSVNEKITKTYSKKELKQFQVDYENTYHTIPFRCRLTEFGKELFLKNHYPNMQLEEKDGKVYIIGGYNQEELAYMTHYFISFGRNVLVEYPEELKESVLSEVHLLLADYQEEKNFS
ncbi:MULTISPECIES: helix-turn-helix transcriptional regulator [Enterococcus]|uniref:helix-turn-helix transcriptional regulator n=1 Tax=Enterococcus TaxID=1350 RepID=UPI0010F57809|nr:MULTISPECIES: WYL domain-containing protein [Enterococcus]KAF1302302.1 transcriptional regulator [Enterococcus sp. JM9B]